MVQSGATRRDPGLRRRLPRALLARGPLLALHHDGRCDGRRLMDLARRAIWKIRSRDRNRPGNLFLSAIIQRSRTRSRLARRGGAYLKLAHGILAMLVTPFHDDYRL